MVLIDDRVMEKTAIHQTGGELILGTTEEPVPELLSPTAEGGDTSLQTIPVTTHTTKFIELGGTPPCLVKTAIPPKVSLKIHSKSPLRRSSSVSDALQSLASSLTTSSTSGEKEIEQISLSPGKLSSALSLVRCPSVPVVSSEAPRELTEPPPSASDSSQLSVTGSLRFSTFSMVVSVVIPSGSSTVPMMHLSIAEEDEYMKAFIEAFYFIL
ncbi:hypothetical protein M6B38_294305 [Iris pallida]|uniref:Uncharacterized protein n=1 Tax=Iris pallida TaxID=29817 RepID=A0AAX6HSL6_IRIPA|nr:hypothetical protein M6B38_294305 [Iris pallida]